MAQLIQGWLVTGQRSRHGLEASAVGSTMGFLGHLTPHLAEKGPQHILPCKPHTKGHPKLSGSAVAHQAGTWCYRRLLPGHQAAKAGP